MVTTKFCFKLSGRIHGHQTVSKEIECIIEGQDIVNALINRISKLTELLEKVGGPPQYSK